MDKTWFGAQSWDVVVVNTAEELVKFCESVPSTVGTLGVDTEWQCVGEEKKLASVQLAYRDFNTRRAAVIRHTAWQQPCIWPAQLINCMLSRHMAFFDSRGDVELLSRVTDEKGQAVDWSRAKITDAQEVLMKTHPAMCRRLGLRPSLAHVAKQLPQLAGVTKTRQCIDWLARVSRDDLLYAAKDAIAVVYIIESLSM